MRWVMIHPPRTGGTSIRTQIGWGAAPQPKDLSGVKHAHYAKLAQRIPDLKDCYRFATVRNPYARAVGLWAMWGANKTPFDVWLEKLWQHRDDLTATKRDGWHFNIDDEPSHHALPQMYFLGDVANFDHLIQFEQRDKDIAIVSEAIGVPINPKVHRKGRNAAPPWREMYNDRARSFVRQMYADDFRELGYS